MGKRLRYVIGTDQSFEFTVEKIAFDGTKSAQDLTGAYVYLEIEQDGVQVLIRDNDPGGSNTGMLITDGPGGVVVATIADADLDGSFQGVADYALLVRLDPGGTDDRSEAIRGLIDLVPELVDVP